MENSFGSPLPSTMGAVLAVNVIHDLSRNESPSPPEEQVLRAASKEFASLHLYPERHGDGLREAVAAHYSVRQENVVVARGSLEVIWRFLVFAKNAGIRDVVYASPGFEAYPQFCGRLNLRSIEVPVKASGRADLSTMRAAARTGSCVLLCNPNNPTGGYYEPEEVDAFQQSLGTSTPLCVDEAYWEYAVEPSRWNTAHLLDAPNVLLTRTFSKAFGLAGLRVGYGLGHPSMVAKVHAMRLPFELANVSQVLAATALNRVGGVKLRCAELLARRSWFIERMHSLSLPVADGRGNFVWLPLGSDSSSFAGRLEDHGIRVALIHDVGVRVTIGSLDALEDLIAVVRRG